MYLFMVFFFLSSRLLFGRLVKKEKSCAKDTHPFQITDGLLKGQSLVFVLVGVGGRGRWCWWWLVGSSFSVSLHFALRCFFVSNFLFFPQRFCKKSSPPSIPPSLPPAFFSSSAPFFTLQLLRALLLRLRFFSAQTH